MVCTRRDSKRDILEWPFCKEKTELLCPVDLSFEDGFRALRTPEISGFEHPLKLH